jgi:hypothetical protein
MMKLIDAVRAIQTKGPTSDEGKAAIAHAKAHYSDDQREVIDRAVAEHKAAAKGE